MIRSRFDSSSAQVTARPERNPSAMSGAADDKEMAAVSDPPWWMEYKLPGMSDDEALGAALHAKNRGEVRGQSTFPNIFPDESSAPVTAREKLERIWNAK